MRGSRKLSLILGTLAVVAVSVVPLGWQAQASSTDDQLRARRAQLVAELQQMSGPRAGASSQLLAAEQALSAVQNQLAAVRARLDGANGRLLKLSQQIQDDEHTVSTSKVDLAQLVRATYVTSSADGFVTAILSADDFSQAMDRMKSAAHVTDEVRQLEARLQDRQTALAQERAQLQKDFADAKALESQLADQNGKLMALVAQRDAAFRNVDGPARAIAAQIADIDSQLAGNAAPVSSSGSCGNHFAYGYCTYYVATRRCIPWFGDAWQWWGAAAAAGYAEGHTPAVGAVAVWGRYGSSPDGHVAYVEAVGPNDGVPAGSFLVSEMNYSGWNRVDRRVVADNAAGLVGFIYGKA